MAEDKALGNVLLGVTGSVATVKHAELAMALAARGATVKLVATRHAQHMMRVAGDYAPDKVAAFAASGIEVLTDEAEWEGYESVHRDPVVHIELRKWADVIVVAPLSANTMAKVVHGQCDNLLTCLLRVWDATPVVVAPAMNTGMWDHPVTGEQILALKKWGVVVVPPVSKTLACGDTGVGAMAAVRDIVDAAAAARQPGAGGAGAAGGGDATESAAK